MGNHLPKHWGTFVFPAFDLRLYFLSFPMIKNHISAFSGVVAKKQVISACHRLLPSTFRLSTLRLLFIFNFSLLIINCGLDVEDSTPPSKPQWVPKSLPEEWPERGIDAHESGGLFLEWEQNPSDEEIKSYHISRAIYYDEYDSLGEYESLITQPMETNPALEFIDRTATKGIHYYYKIKAEDYSEAKSNYSDPLSYTLLPAIGLSSMFPNGLNMVLGSSRQLTWRYAHSIAMEDYCLTLLAEDNSFMWRQLLIPGNYTGDVETWIIPENIILIPGVSYKWRVDMVARYVESRETSGSESLWATFLFPSE